MSLNDFRRPWSPSKPKTTTKKTSIPEEQRQKKTRRRSTDAFFPCFRVKNERESARISTGAGRRQERISSVVSDICLTPRFTNSPQNIRWGPLISLWMQRLYPHCDDDCSFWAVLNMFVPIDIKF